jgi:hypothetical protein
MAEKVKGELKVVKTNDYGFYSVKIDGTWYGTGSKKDPGVVAGDIVEGEFELEKGKYKTITKAGLVKASAKAAPAGAAGPASTGTNWAAKDDSIRYQSSRKDALAFLGLPGVLESIVGKAKPADKVGLVEALVDKYTASYFEDVATFGAVARANGTTEQNDPAAPPAEDEDE